MIPALFFDASGLVVVGCGPSMHFVYVRVVPCIFVRVRMVVVIVSCVRKKNLGLDK